MQLNDTTRMYFERLASISDAESKARYNGLTDPARSGAIQQYFARNELDHYSMLRTSVVPTIINAGFRSNVIPSQAEARLDIRAVPGEDMPRFFERMSAVIGDSAVKIVPAAEGRPDAGASKLDNEMFRALERVGKQMYPQAVTLPYMTTGATDMAQLRAKGVQCYGIGPAVTLEDFTEHWWHSDVEHISEASVYQLAEYTYRVVSEIARR
jgi:acetylornithine deacetylase/succinyl-diaminopimelate desuccinylase-like protein